MTVETDQISSPRRGPGTRMLLGLLILAFIAGCLLMVWLSQHWGTRGAMPQIAGMSNGVEAAGQSPSADMAAGVPANQVAAEGMETQAARIADLEQRLARITLAAQAASYNANRAEALLTAVAARRALDAGRPLGYVEGTLRLRFGDAQPKAVATIVNAAAEPVTLADLRLTLQDIGVGRDTRTDTGWWQGFWREMGGIAIIRKAGAPSPEPEQRLSRARHAVELGQIDDAMRDMAALPPQQRVARWLELARRYNEAHRALDVIEAAAILEARAPVAATAPVPVSTPADTPAPQ